MTAPSSAPIFVVGTPRSGTTLTATILARHSRVFVGGENHFFEDIYARRRKLGSLEDASSLRRVLLRLSTIYGRYNQNDDQERVEKLMRDPRIGGALSECRSYREVLSAFMEMQARDSGKARWGNNTPKDIFHVDDILSFYPDARVLVCVRDVRDFLLSYKNRWKVTTPAHRERLKALYHPMVTSLLWKSTIRRIPALQALVPTGNLMIVRYEALVSQPERVVQDVCRTIGEAYESDMLHVDSHNSSADKSETGIFSSSVGSWRDGLENEEAYIAERLNRSELRRLGYPFQSGAVDYARCVSHALTFPRAVLRAPHANADHRGPLLPYLGKRVKALLGIR